MRRFIILGCVLCSCVTARAQEPPPPAASEVLPSYLEMEAGPGRFNVERKNLAPCRNGQFSALITVKPGAPAGTWAAGADVGFSNGREVTRFSLMTSGNTGTLVFAAVDYLVTGKTNPVLRRFPPQQGFLAESQVRIDVQWKEGRVISGKVGNHSLPPVTSENPFSVLILRAQGAKVKFDQMALECGLIS